ncbi:hypothetical protein AU509_12010 [Lonsdalea britannica]|uniref:Phage protein n=1 Tax=Lonsdalea britannica TaxID=1082704 RepID=A0AAD0WLF3_9GAMM|nr:hypothetical protein [Lonsdalea britannica]AXW87801.1 hypothetical protein CKQ53_13025 [Lonsdalea britannica]OSM95925.1 hypothetical protein AU509_12010 [Lonsdalea britannica]
MSTEQMREEFERWAELVGALPWGHMKKQRTPSGGYSVQVYGYMWTAWKASRSELFVEFPSQEKYDDPLSAHDAINDCKDILSAAGITVKE